jgi:hypothetical protein
MSPRYDTGGHSDTGCGCAGTGGYGTGGYGTGGEGLELPADAFTSLRVSYGMLLGEADFEVLMGNPRGKGMLHAAWLHGSGVIWGFGVSWTPNETDPTGGGLLRVEQGLALDGWGRELRLDRAECLDLGAWAAEQLRLAPEPEKDLHGWVIAEFATCLDHPVPALADPCDVNRRHEVCARVIETVRLRIRADRPHPPPDHPRVRRLLGLDCDPTEPRLPTCGSPDCTKPEHQPDTVDADVAAAGEAMAAANPEGRACCLLRELRRLAVLDAEQLAPAVEDGDVAGLFPVTENDSGVVLARLRMRVSGNGECVRLQDVEVTRDGCRALLPTATIQELLVGSAPRHAVGGGHGDAGGPRLVNGSLSWSTDRTSLRFRLTAPALAGSQRTAVTVTSLSPDRWVRSDIHDVTLHEEDRLVAVHLDQRPTHPLVRVRIRGTGDTPLLGRDPVAPFAGVEAGPPGSTYDGHDAVLMNRLPVDAGTGEDYQSPEDVA